MFCRVGRKICVLFDLVVVVGGGGRRFAASGMEPGRGGDSVKFMPVLGIYAKNI